MLVSLVGKLDNGGIVSREDLRSSLTQIHPGCSVSDVGSSALSDEELEAEIASGLGLTDSTEELDVEIEKLRNKLAKLQQIKASSNIAE